MSTNNDRAEGRWSRDGRRIYDSDFTHDACLLVSGDFADASEREAYLDRIVSDLNEIAALRADRDCLERERDWEKRETEEREDVLRRHGFVRCDIPACNCGSWHARYGLRERFDEIASELAEAGVLNNDTGNMPLKAVRKLIEDRDRLAALERQLEQLRKVTHVSIPTETMEQEFAAHWRSGYQAGKASRDREVEALRADAECLVIAREIAAEQAIDYGIWFVAQTVTEALLQGELRRLTLAVEGDAARGEGQGNG